MLTSFLRKKTVDLTPYIRRLCDVTTPNLSVADNNRSEDRFNRSLPVIICPWVDDAPVIEQLTVAITRDLSDQGVGLIRNEPLTAEEVVVGFWLEGDNMDEPWYFRASVQSSQRIGGGYWLVGVLLEEFMNKNHRPRLEPLDICADFLRPSFEGPVNPPT